jgi:hypothetical protein
MTVHPVRGDFIETPGSVTLDPNVTSDIVVDVKSSTETSAQFKNTDSNNISIKIFGSLGLGWAKLPIKDVTIVKDDNQIIIIDSGYYSLKFEIKNNDSVNTIVDYFISVKK